MLRALAQVKLMASVVVGFAATVDASIALVPGIAGPSPLGLPVAVIVNVFVASVGTDNNVLMISGISPI